ncbi:MAG: alcohol dehydrogenase catalytic domain-containing protein [Alphaproteobacteria bacterium]|jgi:NADPH:quinone reductase-like Zn-dependent oxidoreductase|nr:alcohol dehydrogenase catalytic domain-containing protein [Alphaproteobacteria bacterium]
MKAVVIHEHGDPSVLKYEDIETPSVGPNDVLINIKAVGLNHFDLDVRDGISGYFSLDMPHILGCEGAGVVAEVGSAVTAFKPGQHVLPYLTTSCGHCERCLSGHDNICMSFDKLGVTHWGTYAEYVRVSEHNVVAMPDGLSFVDAAATHVAFATAWELVEVHTKVRQGEFVLVNAAGSGVGSAAVQLANNAGGIVIATAGSGEKLERAKELGARYGINYNEESIEDGVMRITGGRGADVCIEMVGGRVLQESIRAVAHNGRLATCGAHAGEKVEIDMIEFFRKQLTMSGNHFSPKANNVQVLKLIADGAVKPVIAKTFPLQDMGDAHRFLASRNFFGKVVLEV